MSYRLIFSYPNLSIQTFDSDTALDFEFERSKKIPRLVLESATLRAAIENWDAIGQTTRILMSPDESHFSIISKGIVGIAQIDFNEELGKSTKCLFEKFASIRVFLSKFFSEQRIEFSMYRTDKGAISN